MRPRNLPLAIGGAITASLVAVAVLSLAWTPEPTARVRIALRLRPPLQAGLLGTDHFGRDVVSLLMAGAWNSLAVAVPAVLLGALVGTVIGCATAVLRGPFEALALRVSDVVFALPAILSAILIGAAIGPGPLAAIAAIAIFNVPVFVRVSRAVALQVWASDFVLAARSIGRPTGAIVLRDVVPNIAGGLAVQVTIQLALAVLTEAGLSYLGLGVRPPAPSWGRMLADSQTYLAQAPYLAIAPGVAIACAVLGFNLLGDGLRDRTDPRLRER